MQKTPVFAYQNLVEIGTADRPARPALYESRGPGPAQSAPSCWPAAASAIRCGARGARIGGPDLHKVLVGEHWCFLHLYYGEFRKFMPKTLTFV